MARFDERDTIFSRMTLEPGSGRFSDYYSRHPEKDSVDRSFRDAPPGRFADRVEEERFIDSTFALIASMRPFVRGPVCPDRVSPGRKAANRRLRDMALSLGALDSGVAESDSGFFYSVRGRGERYGRDVPDPPPFTFVMSFEMDADEIKTAPDPRQSVEVVKAYLKAAVAALTLAGWIRSLGWNAVAHIDGESEVILPAAAEAAGLGEIGRHGLLVGRKCGSGIRLSAVTTDLPLPVDGPAPLMPRGLGDFCRKCGKCSGACPAGAIPAGDFERGGGVDHEACFGQWKKFGTDCGICLAACPFTRRSE